MLASAFAEELLRTAAAAVGGRNDLAVALDALPAPIYVTDRDGVVIYFNEACVGFAGRTPAVGKDRWCVSWKLYTSGGDPLPHEACPMAEAIRSGQPVRGVTAVAERPDGVRVTFMPLPTPVFDADGALVGAVNILIDVTEYRQVAELRDQAHRCRRLARGLADKVTIRTLSQMADEYEAKARDIEACSREHFRLVA
ncbi:MAG TPA: PAS domain-containing protein [Caulobacteraceae bacterium]|nr:PAS domain-containing protein [Caulobacteraceae bacterium]